MPRACSSTISQATLLLLPPIASPGPPDMPLPVRRECRADVFGSCIHLDGSSPAPQRIGTTKQRNNTKTESSRTNDKVVMRPPSTSRTSSVVMSIRPLVQMRPNLLLLIHNAIAMPVAVPAHVKKKNGRIKAVVLERRARIETCLSCKWCLAHSPGQMHVRRVPMLLKRERLSFGRGYQELSRNFVIEELSLICIAYVLRKSWSDVTTMLTVTKPRAPEPFCV